MRSSGERFALGFANVLATTFKARGKYPHNFESFRAAL